MSLTWSTASDWDAAQDETGVHHEQPTGTDWAASDTVEKGYPTSDEGGSALVAYYPCDEDSGTAANDVSGNGHGLTINGPTVGQSGISGTTCYGFDGTDDVVSASFSMPSTASWTFCAWYYYDDGTSEDYAGVFCNTDGGGPAQKNGIVFDASGNVGARMLDSSDSFHSAEATSETNAWNFAAAIWDGSELRVRHFDSSGTETTNATSVSANDSTDEDNLAIGRAVGDDHFAGRIDECRLYSRPLSQSEINDLYQAVL